MSCRVNWCVALNSLAPTCLEKIWHGGYFLTFICTHYYILWVCTHTSLTTKHINYHLFILLSFYRFLFVSNVSPPVNSFYVCYCSSSNVSFVLCEPRAHSVFIRLLSSCGHTNISTTLITL